MSVFHFQNRQRIILCKS